MPSLWLLSGYVRGFCLALIFLVLATSCSAAIDSAGHAQTSASAPTLLPPTSPAYVGTGEPIHLAWFFKPPHKMPIESLPSAFDLFILTHKDEPARDRLLASGRKGLILEYLMLAEIMDPGDCTSNPYGNQVAYKAGDFCQISQEHPDWFLLDQSGRRVEGRNGKYYMDPGSAGFQAFWLERSAALQVEFGWDGLFLDNVEASRTKFTRRGISLARYPDDGSFQSAVEGFLASIAGSYSSWQRGPILGNIVSVTDDATWNRYIEHLDGAMVESFATDSSENALSFSDWTQQMSRVEWALAQGKRLILVSQGRQQDYELQRFAFASYLLIASGDAAFRYANAASYREAWIYPDYDLPLGNPLGSRYQHGNAWRRDFAHGYVTVDPHTGHAEIVVSP